MLNIINTQDGEDINNWLIIGFVEMIDNFQMRSIYYLRTMVSQFIYYYLIYYCYYECSTRRKQVHDFKVQQTLTAQNLNPIQFAFLLRTVFNMALSSSTLRNTSFATLSVRLIFSILLQRHNSKLQIVLQGLSSDTADVES